MSTKLLVAGPQSAPTHYLFSHGAGAGIETPFMQAVATLLTERGVASFRFEFSYMAARRETGVKRPPPRAERLVDEVRAAVAALPPGPRPLIGGKSMGGRVASLVADDLFAQGQIAGLVCLGYPFHPPNGYIGRGQSGYAVVGIAEPYQALTKTRQGNGAQC
jgi:predicted alpha/beta-hydrolase family hydrolase